MYNHSGYDCNIYIYIKQAFMAKMRGFGNFWSKNKRGGCGKVSRRAKEFLHKNHAEG